MAWTHHVRFRLILAALVLVGVFGAWLSTSDSAQAGVGFERVLLQAGSNQIVYRGPALPAQLIADQIPGLVSLYHWDSATQRHDVVHPTLSAPAQDWSVQTGDVLWLSVELATAWEMPTFGGVASLDLYAGWNVYGWPQGVDSAAAVLQPQADRIEGIWLRDVDSGRFRVYTPDDPTSAGALDLLRPNVAFWLLLSEGAPVSLIFDPTTAPQLQFATSTLNSLTPVASDSTEVERAVVHLQTTTLAGSGFIVEDGLILTAAHIVQGFEFVTVRFFSGERVHGTVEGVDIRFDLALVRVDEMPANTRRLDWTSAGLPGLTTPIWAWGFPLEGNLMKSGYSASVSVSGGFVSAIRERDGVSFLQTDAAMNAGNSGGPITLTNGLVIGLASASFAVGGNDTEGINFAINLVVHRDAVAALVAGD